MKFKNDRYKQKRGGGSKLLQISCRECNAIVCHYQKDGLGGLLRLYLDRISEPQVSISEKSLQCPQGHLIGVLMIYAKEDRPAFRLAGDSIKKQVVK